MDSLVRRSSQAFAAAVLAGAAALAHAQAVEADYRLRVGPAVTGGASGAGLSLQASRNWFGQVGLSQGPVSVLNHGAGTDIFALGGGYRWGNGQSLSLEVSRGRGPGQRLGLALNYDWPRYFVRFAYDPPGVMLSPQDSLRLSAGVRF